METKAQTSLTFTMSTAEKPLPPGLPGGASPGPSASAGTVSRNASTATANNLFMGSSPFTQAESNVRILSPESPSESSAFAELMKISPAEALDYADSRARNLRADDFTEHLRWAGNAAMAQRGLYDFKGAMRTHLSSRPLLLKVSDLRLLGLHYHGKGFTHLELGEWHEADEDLNRARELFLSARLPLHLASAEDNLGNLYARMGLYSEAHGLIESAIGRWTALGMHAMAARGYDSKALTYEASGDLQSAFECSSRAVLSLSRFGSAELKSFDQAYATHCRVAEKLKERATR